MAIGSLLHANSKAISVSRSWRRRRWPITHETNKVIKSSQKNIIDNEKNQHNDTEREIDQTWRKNENSRWCRSGRWHRLRGLLRGMFSEMDWLVGSGRAGVSLVTWASGRAQARFTPVECGRVHVCPTRDNWIESGTCCNNFDDSNLEGVINNKDRGTTCVVYIQGDYLGAIAQTWKAIDPKLCQRHTLSLTYIQKKMYLFCVLQSQ